MNIERRLLIDIIVQPIGKQQIGMTPPTDYRTKGRIIVAVIIIRYMNRQTLALVPYILIIQGRGRILLMTGDEEFTSSTSHGHIDTRFIALGKQHQLRHLQDIFPADLRMTAMRHIELIIEAPENR